jgi:ATP-binding cassette subfamily F protein 3
VVHIAGGQLTHYPGDYQYYLDKTKAVSARHALTAGAKIEAAPRNISPKPAVDRKEQKRREAEERQARSNKRKGQQQLVHQLEKDIQKLEAHQAELTSELEKPETYEKPGRAQQINRELVDIQGQLADLTPKWEREATRLAALDS